MKNFNFDSIHSALLAFQQANPLLTLVISIVGLVVLLPILINGFKKGDDTREIFDINARLKREDPLITKVMVDRHRFMTMFTSRFEVNL